MAEITPVPLKLLLPSSPLRLEFDQILDPDFLERAGLRAYEMLANAGGLEVVSPGDLNRNEFRCVQYVFATTKKEPWATEDSYIPIFDNPVDFMSERGYKLLLEGDSVKEGDIVTYGFLSRNPAPLKLVHMGIVEEAQQPTVISKFNTGPVIRHQLGKVPQYFGTHAMFFRK